MYPSVPPRCGDVYYVKDTCVTFKPASTRNLHETRRPVVVVSASALNRLPEMPLVLVCPISSGAQASMLDVRVHQGDGSLPKKGYVRIFHTQPLLIDELDERIGTLPPERSKEITTRLLQCIGAISIPNVS